jgi:hypothetical protein
VVLTTIYGTQFYLPNDFLRDKQLNSKVTPFYKTDKYSYSYPGGMHDFSLAWLEAYCSITAI